MSLEEYWRESWDTFVTATSLPLAREGWGAISPVPLPPGMKVGVQYGAQIRGDHVTWYERDAAGLWCVISEGDA